MCYVFFALESRPYFSDHKRTIGEGMRKMLLTLLVVVLSDIHETTTILLLKLHLTGSRYTYKNKSISHNKQSMVF